MARLSGKTAAITGGAGGIGAAIARLFAEQGATLALLDLNGDGAAENASALNGAGHYGGAVDVGEEASVASAFATAAEAVGEIDILVNTAAIAGAAPVEEMAVVLGALASVLTITAVALIAAGPLMRLFGDKVESVITRLLGVLLAALAAQYVIDGLRGAFGL